MSNMQQFEQLKQHECKLRLDTTTPGAISAGQVLAQQPGKRMSDPVSPTRKTGEEPSAQNSANRGHDSEQMSGAQTTSFLGKPEPRKGGLLAPKSIGQIAAPKKSRGLAVLLQEELAVAAASGKPAAPLALYSQGFNMRGMARVSLQGPPGERRLEQPGNEYRLFQQYQKSVNSARGHEGSLQNLDGAAGESLTTGLDQSAEHCNTARPGYRNPQLRALHDRFKPAQTQSQVKSTRNNKYQKPYPGYSFNFANVDHYAQSKKLAPLRSQQIQFHRGIHSYAGAEQASIGALGQEASFSDSIDRYSLSPKADERFLRGDSAEHATDTGLMSREVLERAALSKQLQSIHRQMESLKYAGGHSAEASEENENEFYSREEVQRPLGTANHQRIQSHDLPQLRMKAINEAQDEYEMTQRANLEAARLRAIDMKFATGVAGSARFSQSQHMSRRLPVNKASIPEQQEQDQDFNQAAPQQSSKGLHQHPPLPSARSLRTRNRAKPTKLQGIIPEATFGSQGQKPLTSYQKTYSPPRGKRPYHYQTKEEEFGEDMLQMSGGNKYHEGTNPKVGKFINSVQGSIRLSQDVKLQMKDTSAKIFAMMKKEKHSFLTTLLQGENDGHCKGIARRMDPRLKDKQRQNQARMKMIHEDQLEVVRKRKRQADKERLEAKRQRIQARLDLLGDGEVGKPGNSFLNSFQHLKSSMRKSTSDGPGQTHQDETAQATVLPQRRKVQIKLEGEGEEGPLSTSDNADEIELVLQEQDNGRKKVDVLNVTQNTNDSISRDGSGSRQGSRQHTRKKTQAHPKKPNTFESVRNKAQKLDRAMVLQQAMGFKHLSKDQLSLAESVIKAGLSKPLQKLHKYFTSEKYLQTQASNQKISERAKVQKIFAVGFKQLGLNDDPGMENFFRSMCDEGKNDIKYARLNRTSFKAFMQERYSEQVGERIMLFLENQFEHFSRISFPDFQDLIMQVLNTGSDCYRKLVFASFGISNPGRICEHDLFALLEQFKQKESFFFYKDLITRADVPRDYKSVVDDSDKTFFEAFARDVKVVSHIINLRKRMMGVVDMDTNVGIEGDFNVDNYSSEEQYERDICSQIDYLAQIINRRGGQVIPCEVFDMMEAAGSLQEVRNKLCEVVAKNNLLHSKQQAHKKSSMSNGSESGKPDKSTKKSGSEPSSSINFHAPTTVNPCMGKGHNIRTGKKVSDCIYITYDDFIKLVDFRVPGELSSLAEDLISTLTNGKINLQKFEAEMGHYREQGSGGFQGTLHFSREDRPYNYVPRDSAGKAGDSKREPSAKKAGAAATIAGARETVPNTLIQEHQDPFAISKNPRSSAFYQPHIITSPFQIQDNYQGGEFIGKLLFKVKAETPRKKRAERQSFGGDRANLNDTQQSGQADADMPPEDKQKDCLEFDEVRELFSYKEHFGTENFYNIFRCFYLLSNIPREAENNPFALYMDGPSAVRGFQACFGISIEEVALRFHRLFVLPVNKTEKLYKIGILRFYYTVTQMCLLTSPDKNYMKMGFNFYDYDQNGNIGSVDILNFYKCLPAWKMAKVDRQYQRIWQQKLRIVQIKKKEKETGKKSKKIMEVTGWDAEISEDNEDSEEAEPVVEATQHSEDSEGSGSSEEEERSPRRAPGRRRTLATAQQSMADAISARFQHMKTPGQHQAEDFQRAKKISNSWNKVLFETQLLRNYFVDEAVLPKNSVASQTFLNLKMFELRFANVAMERFGGGPVEKTLRSPAIIYFFRERFITAQISDSEGFGYGSSLSVVDQEGCTKLTRPAGRLRGGLPPEQLLLNQLCLSFDCAAAPVTEEFKCMLAATQKIVQVPHLVTALDVNSMEEEREK